MLSFLLATINILHLMLTGRAQTISQCLFLIYNSCIYFLCRTLIVLTCKFTRYKANNMDLKETWTFRPYSNILILSHLHFYFLGDETNLFLLVWSTHVKHTCCSSPLSLLRIWFIIGHFVDNDPSSGCNLWSVVEMDLNFSKHSYHPWER